MFSLPVINHCYLSFLTLTAFNVDTNLLNATRKLINANIITMSLYLLANTHTAAGNFHTCVLLTAL